MTERTGTKMKRKHGLIMASSTDAITALMAVNTEGPIVEVDVHTTSKRNVALVVGCPPIPTFPAPLQTVVDELPVRCMRPCDVDAYLEFERQARAPPFELEGGTPYHPCVFAAFTIAWWDVWRGKTVRTKDEHWLFKHLVQTNGTCPIQIMQDDHILVTTLLKRFGTPPPAVLLLNLYIRAMGCLLETVEAFGDWVDASNQDAFAVFVASVKGPVFEPKRQVVGFKRLKENVNLATREQYAVLNHALSAHTGNELKQRIMSLEGLGAYRSHVLFSYLATTRLTPFVGRNGTWTDAHFTGKGAVKGLGSLQGSWTVASIQRDWNPMRLTLDDIEHCFCAFHSFLKRRDS